MLDVEKAILCREQPVDIKIPGFLGNLLPFQKQGVAYMHFIRKSVLADQTGLGKSWEIIALNCLHKHLGLLQGHVQVVPAQSLYQWLGYYATLAPHLRVRVAAGTYSKADRVSIYNLDYDVLLVSYHIVQRDWQYIAQTYYNTIALDEASFFKNPDTKTADFVQTLASRADWVIPMSATPIQNCLVDLWSIFQTFHMPQLLGPKAFFVNRYCVRKEQEWWESHKKRTANVIVGYKNVEELTGRIGPFYIRRRVEDVEHEQGFPTLTHKVEWLQLHPEQREAYNQVKQDTLANRTTYRGVKLRNNMHLLHKILDGLRSVDWHNQDVSVKADYVMHKLTTDLVQEKAVIFSWYKSTIRSLEERFRAAGIKYGILWGDDRDHAHRYALQEQFRLDPDLRVIIGTTALEMSLNLQAARYIILYDLLTNPARVQQIMGRIRRLGSQHKACIALSLQTLGTIEEGLYKRLAQRQAVSDFVFGEQNDVFEKLTDEELWTIIQS